MKILGIDLGIASIGWGLVDWGGRNTDEITNQNKLIASGVRIFTKAEHPKSGSSLALPRREARGRRRVLGRKRKRLKEIKKLIIESFNLPESAFFEIENTGSGTIYKEKNKIDIWQLRSEALERKLEPKELARVLTQIAKRRGYQSNSKSDNQDDEKGKVLIALKENKKKMTAANCKTAGQFLYQQWKKEQIENSPQTSVKGEWFSKIRNTTDDYRHSVTRLMLEDEIDQIFSFQKKHHSFLSDEFIKQYHELAFFQNPLKSFSELVGNCTFEKGEKRAPKKSYSAECFVVIGKINNTVMVDEKHVEKKLSDYYSIEEILTIFQKNKEVKYQTLRRKLKLPPTLKFKVINYHSNPEFLTKLPKLEKFIEKEKWMTTEQKNQLVQLNKDQKEIFSYRLRNYLNVKKALQLNPDFKFIGLEKEYKKEPESIPFFSLSGYHEIKKALDLEDFEKIFQDTNLFDKIALEITLEKDVEQLAQKLDELIPISIGNNREKMLSALAAIDFKAFNNLSLKAINKLLPLLKSGKRYDEACKEVYGHHSKFEGEKNKFLRTLNQEENWQLTNPVVKRAYAQFRKVVNQIIRKYGSFDVMHIELSRELKHSYKQRKEIEAGQKDFRENKESAAARFKENFKREPSGSELLKMRLWDEQNGRCLYSHEAIEIDRLFQDHKYAEIDHILPVSRTFDNSLNNKVLVLSKENQEKKNRTPFEWIGKKDENNPAWLTFRAQVGNLKNIRMAKRNKLFNTTLSSRHGNEIDEDNMEQNDFIQRNLNDTQYLARFIKNFVENNLLFKENSAIKQKVKVRNGMLTAQLRYQWGIYEKLKIINKRDKHFHHAIDAVVIACSTQSEVQRMSTYAARFKDYLYKKAEEKSKIKQLKSASPLSDNDFLSILEIFPSFAPRRKVTGAAHEETFYSGKNYTVKGKNKEEETTSKTLVGSSKLYPVRLNHGRILAKKDSMPRIDLFQHLETRKFYIVPIYTADFVKKTLPNLAIVSGKDKNGEKKPWIKMDEDYEFITSIYKNDFIEIEMPKETISGYFSGAHSNSGGIYIKNPEGLDKEKNYIDGKGKDTGLIRSNMGIQSALSIKKFDISPLGEIKEVKLPQTRVGTIHQLRAIKKAIKEE